MRDHPSASIMKPFIFHLKCEKKKKLNQEVNQQSKVIITQNKNGVSTCMLLWAKKGQNAEWKLTSTFFHPNLCKPLIISSVNILKAIITLVMGQWTDNSNILNGGRSIWGGTLKCHVWFYLPWVHGTLLYFSCWARSVLPPLLWQLLEENGGRQKKLGDNIQHLQRACNHPKIA